MVKQTQSKEKNNPTDGKQVKQTHGFSKKKTLKTQYTCPSIHQLKQKNWDLKSIN